MTTCHADASFQHVLLKKGKLMSQPRALLAVTALAGFIGANNHASATDNRSERLVAPTEWACRKSRSWQSLRSTSSVSACMAPTAIVRAPVSSGQRGRETPAGIFSIIQKQADHYSNLYDDAYMPHMQRITWSGIALHGGVLPGRAASGPRIDLDTAGHAHAVGDQQR